MEQGTLIHKNQSSNVDVEIDNETYDKLISASFGHANEIEVTVTRAYTGKSDICIAIDYEYLRINGMSHDVEILEKGIPKMVRPGTKIIVRVTRVEESSSAIFQ